MKFKVGDRFTVNNGTHSFTVVEDSGDEFTLVSAMTQVIEGSTVTWVKTRVPLSEIDTTTP